MNGGRGARESASLFFFYKELNMKKLPPIEKIYEAYTAIADNRIRLVATPSFAAEKGTADVKSSDGTKSYTVSWDIRQYSSDDNATFWQGYAGYPVIALMMLQGLVPYEKSVACGFSHVNWTELNARHKRDYAAAVSEIVQSRNLDREAVALAAAEAYSALERLDAVIVRLMKAR